MIKVKGHYRTVKGKRIRVKAYKRSNPITKVRRHWRKSHEH